MSLHSTENECSEETDVSRTGGGRPIPRGCEEDVLQEKKLGEQETKLVEQGTKLIVQEVKLAKQEKKLVEQEERSAEQEDLLQRVESKLDYKNTAYYCVLQ